MRLNGSIRLLGTAALVATLGLAAPAGALEYKPTPFFAAQVKAGKLPPVAKRVPKEPMVVTFDGKDKVPGQPGGEMRILMSRGKDTRIMVVYGYARLVAFTPEYKIVPDIVRDFTVEEGRIFTFHLRKGHRWSDGKPFTSDDFRYWWEDVLNHKVLARFGLPTALLVDGERPKVEFPDKHTVRYTWSKPNPYFLPALAGATPVYIYGPKHYLKKFHIKYAKKKWLKKQAKKSKTEWARKHSKAARMYRNQNIDLPTLQPWKNITPSPAERYVFVRNPYYYRVDSQGYQLPYIDRVIMIVADSKIVPAKTGAGEADLQARYLRFTDFTFLKRSELRRKKFKVYRWSTATGAQIALYPNLNNKNPIWRKLLRDVRFRRALSLGIDRREINEVMYYGLAEAGANTVLPKSPLYKKELRRAWAYKDYAKANALLDDIGLTKRDAEGFRLLPNGERLEIIVEAANEGTEYADVMRLIQDSWKKIGVKLYPKLTRREMFRRRIVSGLTQVSMWSGLDYALLRPDIPPDELAPTNEVQLQWPLWGLYWETKGKRGEPPDTPMSKELVELLKSWRTAATYEERREIYEKMLSIHAEQVYSIGIVGGVPQPVVVSNELKNVPKDGVYAWEPGAHFGIYKPDTFWLTEERRGGEQRAEGR